MNQNKKHLLFLALAVSTMSAISFPDRAEGKDQHPANMPMAEMLKDKSGDVFDKHYLQMMIQHHKGGVMMANLALQKAIQEKVKDLGRTIVSAQSKEIEQMSGWLSEWYKGEGSAGVEPEASKEEMKKMMVMLEKAEGAEFDQMFLRHMTMHHEEAIGMCKMADEKANHSEVKEFARKIAKDQAKEVEEMADMLKKS